MQTDSRRRRRHGFAPPSELLDELADLNEEGTARHMDRAQELAEAEARNAEGDALRADMARELNIVIRGLTKSLGKVSQMLERLAGQAPEPPPGPSHWMLW